jgi:putative sigma-54 modulation protein
MWRLSRRDRNVTRREREAVGSFYLEGKLTMNVEITGRHILITPAIRTYLEKRLRKLEKILGNDISFHVIVDVEKNRQTAEILLKSKLLDLTGKGQTNDMYNSIVLAIEKIEKQALKHKSKLIEGKRQRAKVKSVATKLDIGAPASRSLVRKSNSVREEDVQRKPMAIEEAVIELDHSDYPFVVFRNVDSDSINVLYRRKDGTLSLIRT